MRLPRWVRFRLALILPGAAGTALALFVAPAATFDAAALAWPPFVLVAGLLLIGFVANEDGVFRTAAALLSRTRGGQTGLYAATMLLVALVTVFLNLDTSAAFVTPLAVYLARSRGANGRRFLYGAVFMSNAASLLLPGSNLTNLLILNDFHISGSVFLSRMIGPWTAAVVVTGVVVALLFRGGQSQPGAAVSAARRPGWLGIGGIVAAAVITLALGDAALPMLGAGVFVAGVRLAQRRIAVQRLRSSVDVLSLLGVFLVVVALGTLARTWSDPGRLMAAVDPTQTAIIGAVASVLVNNLPAAVLLGSQIPAHPRFLLLGLNIGPNLAVTGSLSALIWWQAAVSAGARPSALRYSAVGIVLAPLTLAAAVLAARL